MLPSLLKNKIVASLEEHCPTCSLQIEKVDLSLWEGRARFTHPLFTYSNRHGTRLSASSKSLEIHFSPTSLLTEAKKVNQIVVDQPQVVIIEDTLKKEGSPKSPEQENIHKPLVSFVIEKVKVKDGSFRYQKKTRSKQASLTLTEIQSDIKRFGTPPELLHRPVQAHATGKLEESGQFELSLVTPVFSKKPEAWIDLYLRGLNLDDTNRYFTPAEGLVLHGNLISGHALAHLKDKTILGHVNVTYKDLELHFKEKQNRNPLETFFLNVGKGLKLKEDNLDKGQSARLAKIDKTRKQESLISFILKGMGDAVVKVATS